MEPRDCRYQAAIVDSGTVLLLRVRPPGGGRAFWLVPGGGREEGESEIECVLREVREETGLTVEVVRLLWEQEVPDDRTYRRAKTYLCRRVDGVAVAGAEPESEHHVIEEVGWFSRSDRQEWGEAILNDAQTCSFLGTLREVLDSEPH